MARTAAAAGIAAGIVALTGATALAVDDGADTEGSSPPGHSRSEWARGDHQGPPPWARGHAHGRDKDRDKGGRKGHGPPPWANNDGDKNAKKDKPKKAERRDG